MNKTNDTHKQTLIALRKSKSHIEKIIKMVEEDTYCIDILHQILAVNGLINSASSKILKNHMQTCLKRGLQTNDETEHEELINEIIEVINLSKKTK